MVHHMVHHGRLRSVNRSKLRTTISISKARHGLVFVLAVDNLLLNVAGVYFHNGRRFFFQILFVVSFFTHKNKSKIRQKQKNFAFRITYN